MRYALVETEHGRAWGECVAVEGLFGAVRRGTYELSGWAGEGGAAVGGWVGSWVWLVPEDGAGGPWLLEDAESAQSAGRRGADSLVLTGLDDYEGPPEGHDGRVRVHDGHQWLGSCGAFTRILPAPQASPPLVLRGFAPSDRLRAALAKGTRRALDLEEAALEIRDDRGELFTDHLLWTRVTAWRPSSHGADLIDLELDANLFTPVPTYAQPVWEQWIAGPPTAPGAWTGLDTRLRGVWLELVRRGWRRRDDRPAGHAYELDGRHITDEPSLYLALGEAVNGAGGYFGGCLSAVEECLGGGFGCTVPAALLWRDAETARAHVSEALFPDGQRYDLFRKILDVLADRGIDVTLA